MEETGRKFYNGSDFGNEYPFIRDKTGRTRKRSHDVSLAVRCFGESLPFRPISPRGMGKLIRPGHNRRVSKIRTRNPRKLERRTKNQLEDKALVIFLRPQIKSPPHYTGGGHWFRGGVTP